jgi:hypothetical protein
MTAADRTAPLTDDALLQERISFLLRRASTRQLWMMYLDADDVQSEVLMPCSDLPDPATVIPTGGRGGRTVAEVLSDRVRGVMSELRVTQVVFVWERPGGPRIEDDERMWARALGAACASRGVRVRGQFALHDSGVRVLAPDDYVGG